jgi:ribosomal protein S12 methylthiotransferase
MKAKAKQPVRVGFMALGCPKNIVDSEKMLAEIAQDGFIITTDTRRADVVVINTCGFIEPAKQEAFEAIKEAVGLKKKGKVKKVIVAGCLPERIKEDIFNQADGIDAIVGLGGRDSIAKIIHKVLNDNEAFNFLDEKPAVCDDRGRLIIGPTHKAYLRISEGCDWKCTFCTVPAIRGSFRSKPAEIVLAEAKELAESGVKELIIIGQDITSWGRDLHIKDGLVKLLKDIEKIKEFKWIRLLYLYPAMVSDSLLETMAQSERIVHYLDIPLQHINDWILQKMHRAGSSKSIYELVKRIREKMPDVMLRTTFIVGFPGETDEQFEQLIKFVEWARFDALGCFKYYAEEGTEAAKMGGQVSEEVKNQRVEKLMLIQQKIAFEKNQSRVGSELECIVDEVDKRNCRGRFYGQAPEIDSVCIIKKCRARVGDFIRVKVVGTKDYDLLVEQIYC